MPKIPDGDRPTFPIKLKYKDDSLTQIMSIIKIISINQYTLTVYYTSSDCYQYSIIDEKGVVTEPDDIFYSSEGAEREGRKAIETVSN